MVTPPHDISRMSLSKRGQSVFFTSMDDEDKVGYDLRSLDDRLNRGLERSQLIK